MSDMDNTASYKTVSEPPTDYQRWHLYGAGLENVGKDGKPETVALMEPGPDEILVRHDAVGICYSDIKIVNLGAEHPRLQGRDLVENPVVMGHEVALTVVKAGANQTGKFHSGERFIVQADVYYKGRNLAYGYALLGGMAQYGLVGPEVLEGDEGCYLLPIEDKTGYAEAALVEPWACVEAAYHWKERPGPTPEDRALLFKRNTSDLPADANWTVWGGENDDVLGTDSYDYVLIDETPTAEEFETICKHLTKGSLVVLHLDKGFERPVSVDVGRIHYDGWLFTSWQENKRSDLLGGGTSWFIGAAGPMGQMHVQRALQLPNPPAKIVCTDRHDVRLAALESRLGAMAKERGVELVTINVRTTELDHAALAPNGYDDIVVMVPSIEAIEEGVPYLAQNGILNVFAGVARGTMATLDVSDIAFKNVRVVGTSGSSIEDMRRTRDLMEKDRLDTGASLAAIGGLSAFRDGLDAVKNSRFPGKTVIFPQIEGLPLTALPDLKDIRPDVYAKLKDGQFWTADAETELLKEAKH